MSGFEQISASGLATSTQWFALHTHSKHEAKIASELDAAGFCSFLPTAREVRQWSDRRKVLDVPLFSCYVFVNVSLSTSTYLRILKIPGVLRWLARDGVPCEIPSNEIDAVRRVANSGVAVSPYSFLKTGDRVRVHGGCLEGLEGILVSDPNGKKLVVTVEHLQRSICISGDCYTFERCEQVNAKA